MAMSQPAFVLPGFDCVGAGIVTSSFISGEISGVEPPATFCRSSSESSPVSNGLFASSAMGFSFAATALPNQVLVCKHERREHTNQFGPGQCPGNKSSQQIYGGTQSTK